MGWFTNYCPMLKRIENKEDKIMGLVEDIKTTLDSIPGIISAVATDIDGLKGQIATLQDMLNAGGAVTAADLQTIMDKASAIKASLTAVDQATP